MSTTIIEKLFALGDTVTGKAYRMVAGRRTRDGAVQPFETDNFGSLNIGFGNYIGTKDIFSRLRVTTPFSLFDGKQLFDKQPLLYEESAQNGASSTHLPNEASTRMDVTTTTNSRIIRQSREYVAYEPGRTQFIVTTGVFGSAAANLRRRMGYFDASNGLFLEQNGTTDVAMVRRSFVTGSVVDERQTQANWSIDPLDGSGPSGKTLDLSKFVVMFIEFGWLGGAGARIGFFIEGIPVYAHFFPVSMLSTVFMSTPTLPVRWEIENLDATSGSMYHTCGTVFSEGGFDPSGIIGSRPTFTPRAVTTTPIPLVAVRLRTAYARGLLIPKSASAQVTSPDDIICQVIIRPTITTGAWVTTETGQSEYNVTATGYTGGYPIATFFANDNGAGVEAAKIDNALKVAADFAGAADIVALVARTDTGSANVLGELTWKEVV